MIKTNNSDLQKTNGKAAATKAKFSTRNDIDLATREKVIGLLNTHLACTFDLMSQTKQAHWNVKGPHFIGLHELFDTFAETLETHVDTLAERVTALGGVAIGTVRMAAGASMLEEYPSDIAAGRDHVTALSLRYGALGKMLREAIAQANGWEDADTADILTDVSREVDKSLWFLEAHLQADA
jgi:starvation-inducible DNA-binding protein